jgi:hypothetical protein
MNGHKLRRARLAIGGRVRLELLLQLEGALEGCRHGVALNERHRADEFGASLGLLREGVEVKGEGDAVLGICRRQVRPVLALHDVVGAKLDL